MEASDRTRIAIYYSIWATICAAVAGLVVALIHTWFFSYNPGRSAIIETLFSGAVAAVGIAAAQMAVPRTELGWIPDLAIIVAVTVAITVGGSRRVAAAV